jgi:hypothetical protein
MEEKMADEVEREGGTSEAEPLGLLPDGATRIAVMVLAVFALAGISAGAWLRFRRS